MYFTVQDLDVTSSGSNMCSNSMIEPKIGILTIVQFGDHALLPWKFYLIILDTIQITSVHLISTSILLSFSFVCSYGCIPVTFSATSGHHMPVLLTFDSALYFFVCCTILSVSQTIISGSAWLYADLRSKICHPCRIQTWICWWQVCSVINCDLKYCAMIK